MLTSDGIKSILDSTIK